MNDRTLVVGEALVDIVHRTDGTVEEHPGGSPLNVAIGLARLGHHVHYAARFGDDLRGHTIRAHLEREPNITLTRGTASAPSTSTATATLDERGAATYEFDLTWDVANALDGEPTGHVHTGSIAATLAPGADAVLEVARRGHETGTVSYDPNARPTLMGDPATALERVEAVAANADVVKASDEDIAWFYGATTDATGTIEVDDAMRRFAELGASLVVITRGDAGCRVYVAGTGEWADVPPVENVIVMDTVGAGDSFMAGLISGLLDAGLLGSADARAALAAADLDAIMPAVTRANVCAAVTVSRAGANPPTRAELPS
ncbi:carbohydrate kinase family protein [Mobilicoccus massiliensis]|uniref:carbohydrate kinase family protein n=1 Tax=Mobilicoccus massiliensis TaxID=1522310 RepID=UPI0005916EFC|nr:carbohydrate kinase [Mobilicoccus massiliensis]